MPINFAELAVDANADAILGAQTLGDFDRYPHSDMHRRTEARMTVLSRESFVVVDAGARYGLYPSWEPAAAIAQFNLFACELVEAARLDDKCSGMPRNQIHNMAIDRQPGMLKFELKQHRVLTSTYQRSPEAIAENDRAERFASLGTFDVKTETLDNLFKEHPVHFLKLDVEGAELQFLAGARELLKALRRQLALLFRELQ